MVFEYSVRKTFDQSIDIVDIGNTALRCTNETLEEFYIITKTVLGKTSIIKFGPICPDLDLLVIGFQMTFQKINYKETKIAQEISKYINDNKKEITDITEITEFEAWENFPAVQAYFENESI